MQAGTDDQSDLTSAAPEEDFESRVRNLAYELWLKEGQPEGREVEFWLRAESRIRSRDEEAPPLHDSGPADAHDDAASDSFPASDPIASTGVTHLRSTTRHDLPEGEHPVDEEVQEEAATERKRSGGYG